MGTTAASLHVRLPAGLSQKALATRIVAAYRKLGYLPATASDPEGKTAVLVPSAGFLSIYDSTNALLDTGELKDLGAILSKSLKTGAVFASVYDSDRFEMILFAKGAPVDAVAGTPEELPDHLPRMAGKQRARKWTALFGTAVDGAALGRALDAHRPDAEGTLAELAGLIGLTPAAVLSAFGDEFEDSQTLRFKPDPAAARIDPGMVLLEYLFLDDDFAYHRVQPAAWPMPASSARSCEWGMLSKAAGFDRARVVVSVEGDASFRVQTASMAAFKFYNGQIVGAAGPARQEPVSAPMTAGADGRMEATLEDLGVPPHSRTSTTSILVLLSLSITAERGEAILHARVEPEGVSDAAVALPPVRFAAVEPAWIPLVSGAHPDFPHDGSGRSPLHADEASRVTEAARRNAVPLCHPAIASSVAIVRGTDGLEAVVRPMVERWLEPLSAHGEGILAVRAEKHMTAAAHVAKTSLEDSAAGVVSSRKWDELWKNAAGYQTLLAGFRPGGTSHPVLGIGIQRSMHVEWSSPGLLAQTLAAMRGGDVQEFEDFEAVHVFRWCIQHPDCIALTGGAPADGADWNDALSAQAQLLQAWTARWCWIPLFDRAEGYEPTPYERASTLNWFRGILPGDNGLHHVKMEGPWCSSVLRAVAPRMWLGAELAGAIDEASLASVADVAALDAVRTVTLRDDASLTDLERALLPVLPVESVRIRR